MSIIKRLTAAILVLVMVAAICACGNDDSTISQQIQNNVSTGSQQVQNNVSTGSQQVQTPLSSVENIIDAFAAAGYIYENVDTSLSDLGYTAEDGVTSYAYYGLLRERNFPGIPVELMDYGELIFLQFSNENNAEREYNMVLNSLEEDEDSSLGPVKQTNTQHGKRAVSNAPFGDKSAYGESIILSRKGQTVVYLYIDWDDYQDSLTEYDYLPEEILKDCGY